MRTSGLCDERDFEINADPQIGRTNGPEKSRLAHANNPRAKLLRNYAVYCHPPFDSILPKPSMMALLRATGCTGKQRLNYGTSKFTY